MSRPPGLDPIVRREFIETVIGAYQSGEPERRTVFVSTHLISEFEGLIDEFTIIEQGCELLTLEADHARDRFPENPRPLFPAARRARIGRRVEHAPVRPRGGTAGRRQQRSVVGAAPRVATGGTALRIAVAGGNFRGVRHIEKSERWKIMSATTIQVQFNAETQRTRRSAELPRFLPACLITRPVGGPGLQNSVVLAIICRPRALTRRMAGVAQQALRISGVSGKIFPLGEPLRSLRLCVSVAAGPASAAVRPIFSRWPRMVMAVLRGWGGDPSRVPLPSMDFPAWQRT